MGEDPDFHLKLGRGSLSDIEFTAQMLQLLEQAGLQMKASEMPHLAASLNALSTAAAGR